MLPASRPARATSREPRRSPRLLPLSALLLVVVACQGATGGAPPKSGSAPQTAPGGATAAPPAQPIKIGALFSTTGLLAPFGTDGLPGAQIYVDEINAQGGVNGRPIQLIHVDDESKPEQSVSGAKRLIQQERVVAVAGPVSTVVSASVSPVFNESKVPAVGCICYYGIPITPYEFSVFPLNGMMENQAQFARQHNVTRLGIISQAGSLAEQQKQQFVPVLEREGLQIVGFEQFQPADTDLTPLLARLRSNGAQQVYVAASGTPAALAAKNFKQLNYSGYYWTFVGNANEPFINLVGDAADVANLAGLKILVYKDLPDSDPQKARLTEFARKYVARANKEPGTYAAVGYDAMMSIVEAIKVAGDNPERIRDALENQSGLQLLNGTLSRGAQDHNGLVPDWLTIQIDPAAKQFTITRP
jgi:branched-chain amino acid transport system substrate-binding protein